MKIDYQEICTIALGVVRKEASLNSENSAFFLGHVPSPSIEQIDEPMDILMHMIKEITDAGCTVERVQTAIRETAMFKGLSQSQKDFIESRMSR